jgi:bacteriocin biosynthesis cyclodehydratase domain-containing protein
MPDGVYLRNNNNHLMLKGKSLYPLLERLIPHLNGHTTLEELTGGLDAGRKSMITHLVEKLLAHNFLYESSPDQAATLSPQEQPTSAANLAFIGSFQPSATSRLEAFRNSHLLLVGEEPACSVLVQACLQCDVKQISALVTPGDEVTSQKLPGTVDAFTGYARSEQQVQWLLLPDPENLGELREQIQCCDAVLHLATRPALARAHLLNRLCIEEQKPSIQALVAGNDAWIGPLVCPEVAGCWECAWLRWQANHASFSESDDLAFRDQPQIAKNYFLNRPAATMLAQRLVFALFKYVTRIGSLETQGHVSILHLTSGLSEQHAFLPHPLCQACQHPMPATATRFMEQVQQIQQQTPVDRNTLLEHLPAGLIDERSGLLTTFTSDPFVQIPLAICQVTLANPALSQQRVAPLTLTVAGRDTADARWRAFEQACTHYAARLVDQRRLFSLDPDQIREYNALSANQLVYPQTSSLQPELWIWALDLLTQRVYPVSAAQVFGQQDQRTAHAPALAPGISAGTSWAEAISLALLSWCNYFTVKEMADVHQPFAQVNLVSTRLTPEGIYDAHLLQTTGELLAVYDITGSLQVPTFVTCLGNRAVACTTHCDAAQAIGMGLERAVQRYQAEQCQPYEQEHAPDLPLSLRGAQWSVPRYASPETWPDRSTWLLQRLRDAGLRALAVPLNHDPALSGISPLIVRVVLSNVDAQRGA